MIIINLTGTHLPKTERVVKWLITVFITEVLQNGDLYRLAKNCGHCTNLTRQNKYPFKVFE